jgi:MYXO-CTERM domain-containing protein
MFPRLAFAVALAVALAAPLAPSAARAQTIDTRGPGRSASISTNVIGQTFTVPLVGATSSTLTDFTLWLGYVAPDGPFDFRTYLYAWGGDRPVGSALYASPVRAAQGAATWFVVPPEQFAIPGGVSLTPGAQYIAFIKPTSLLRFTTGVVTSSAGTHDTYAGGGMRFIGNGNDPVAGASFPWAGTGRDDLMFVANFAPPTVSTAAEPAPLVLMGAGLLALVGVVRRRRHA